MMKKTLPVGVQFGQPMAGMQGQGMQGQVMPVHQTLPVFTQGQTPPTMSAVNWFQQNQPALNAWFQQHMGMQPTGLFPFAPNSLFDRRTLPVDPMTAPGPWVK